MEVAGLPFDRMVLIEGSQSVTVDCLGARSLRGTGGEGHVVSCGTEAVTRRGVERQPDASAHHVERLAFVGRHVALVY